MRIVFCTIDAFILEHGQQNYNKSRTAYILRDFNQYKNTRYFRTKFFGNVIRNKAGKTKRQQNFSFTNQMTKIDKSWSKQWRFKFYILIRHGLICMCISITFRKNNVSPYGIRQECAGESWRRMIQEEKHGRGHLPSFLLHYCLNFIRRSMVTLYFLLISPRLMRG